MSATIKIEERSYRDFQRKIGRMETVVVEWTYEAMIKFLTNAQTLAKNKLKSDGHIVYGRLRNSIYVKEKSGKNEGTYTANGKQYNNKLEIQLKEDEAAVGTNVEYAEKIEFIYDSFLYWGVKHSDANQMGRDISQKLLGFKS